MTDTEYRNTIDYLYGLQMVGIKLGLDNIRLLLESLGNPQRRYPVVHIAGTNGKGSTAAFLAAILTASGYRTGLYTSPHLVDFSERIRIDGRPIPEAEVVAFTARVRPVIDEHRMTFFEATTAMAFQYFAENDCEIAIIETGLGGRLDATNIVSPEVSIITSLGIEHTEFLGNTLEEIAAEKGGIVKDGVPLLTAVTQPAALNVLQNICAARRAPLERIMPPIQQPVYHDVDRMTVVLDVIGLTQPVNLELIGNYQVANAMLAIRAAGILYEKGQKRITAVTIGDAVRHVRKYAGIAGRFLRVQQSPEIILDVAHNPAAVEVLLTTLERVRKPAQTHLVFGLMGTKDYTEIARILSTRQWASITVVQASSPGALKAESLDGALQSHGIQAAVANSVMDGVSEATGFAKAGETVLIFGSHYVVGEYLTETEFLSKGS